MHSSKRSSHAHETAAQPWVGRVPPAFIVIIAGMVAALHIGKIPPAIPVLRDALGVSLVEAGFLLSMVQMAGMLGGVFIGLAADGFGLRRSMLLGQLVLASASLAGAWATQPAELLVLRALEGLGFLLVVLPVPSLIRQLVPPSRLALHLGLWGTYMATGTSLVLAGGPVLMAVVGWQGLWVILAVVSLAVAGWLLRRVPSDAARRAAAAAATASANAAAPARVQWSARLRDTLTSWGPWRVAITFSMYSSQWLAVIGFFHDALGVRFFHFVSCPAYSLDVLFHCMPVPSERRFLRVLFDVIASMGSHTHRAYRLDRRRRPFRCSTSSASRSKPDR